MTSPAVSVCIPVYRGEDYLAETVRSVLEQTYRDFELVILDNASPDDSGRIARSFRDSRIRVETNPTLLPQPHNWRRAVELCRAPLVKLVCADDLLHPRCLELQVGAMDADPGLAVVAAKRHMIDESSRILVPHRGLHGMIGVRTYVDVARRVVRNGANPIGEPGGVLFRRDDYDAVGGWNPERCYAMDLDLWLRLLCRGDFLGLPVSLAAFRIAHTSLSADNSTGIDEHQRAIVAELVASGDLLIRRRDRLAGRLNTPIARLRRRALFALSSRAARREERSHSPQGSSSSDATADGNPEPGVAHQRTVDDVRVAS
jgi:glycosyltransferase involved in cell wall biosynthesis